ncbi:cytochrome (ubi)quinol oxidase subunit III [Bacillus taeanensis]|uniref:Cytochrome (Ubi)quinol oxidase subunit III n=1 Tax=Bacillus taeanensis TaxID=273032 RepID=A0A366XX79_9BACI|nr:cytochrome (ubi)quinol oxidase subunit III [Bacillus taeanensis]RBW70246.1 cytochrome (ubi)quinol oxidase subunit III [Bacillus taeanensis]
MAAHTPEVLPAHPEKATLEGKNKFLGFWLFLGAETVTFATLFGTYLGLRHSTAGGPTAEELFKLPMVFAATMILLISSLWSVYAVMAMKRHDFKKLQLWMGVTVVFGLAFLGLEIYEFVEYVHEGHGFTTSAFGSAFYFLLGTHGAHVAFGCIWITLLIIRNAKRGLTTYNAPKYYLAALYWHFVDVVWVFIFTVVYLMGKVG